MEGGQGSSSMPDTAQPERGQQQDAIEADENAADSQDDGYETDERTSASTSVASGVRDYVFENNRRYHRFQEGRYMMPNDEPEQEREDMKHAMIVSLCEGKLHVCPLENPQKILDIGTGTGIWAVDVGDEYPEAEVIGIDLSPIQPTWVPPNVRFLVDDAEAEWLYGPSSLDYVHARHVCMAIKNWPKLVGQAYEALKPGGWIELQELRFIIKCDDDSMPANREDYRYCKYIDLCMEGYGRFGVNARAMENNKTLLEEGGFVNIGEKVWKVPIGTWPRDPTMKTIGLYNRSIIIDGLQGVGMAPLTRALKWTPEEVEVFLVDVRRSLMKSPAHAYYTYHCVYGQKPPGKAS